MSDAANPDVLRLGEWIGREEVVSDRLTAGLAARFHATLGLPGDPAGEGQPAPRLIHFCLCLAAVGMDGLGDDGHPRTGGFLPPVPLPRRMWAGSRIAFSGDIAVGDEVVRRTRVADVAWKEGRSGALCFVTVDHAISARGREVIAEQQTIVYRAATGPSPATTPGLAPSQPPPSAKVDVTEPLLFRYSALTFNAHRIHYDLPYATGEEGYPGLVVHGPLQATLLLHHAAREAGGRAPDWFTFRSGAPLFAHDPLELHHRRESDGSMALWTARPGGPAAMQAQAQWA